MVFAKKIFADLLLPPSFLSFFFFNETPGTITKFVNMGKRLRFYIATIVAELGWSLL